MVWLKKLQRDSSSFFFSNMQTLIPNWMAYIFLNLLISNIKSAIIIYSPSFVANIDFHEQVTNIVANVLKCLAIDLNRFPDCYLNIHVWQLRKQSIYSISKGLFVFSLLLPLESHPDGFLLLLDWTALFFPKYFCYVLLELPINDIRGLSGLCWWWLSHCRGSWTWVDLIHLYS